MALGGKKLVAVRDRVFAEVEQQLSAGRREASVVITQSELSVIHSLPTVANVIRQELDQSGYRVTAMTDPGWSYQLTMTVVKR